MIVVDVYGGALETDRAEKALLRQEGIEFFKRDPVSRLQVVFARPTVPGARLTLLGAVARLAAPVSSERPDLVSGEFFEGLVDTTSFATHAHLPIKAARGAAWVSYYP